MGRPTLLEALSHCRLPSMLFRSVLFRAWRASAFCAQVTFARRLAAQVFPALPVRPLFTGALAMCTAAATAAACDTQAAGHDQDPLRDARRIVQRLATSESTTDAFIERSREVYGKHKSREGKLSIMELTAALKDLEDWRMPIAAEMAPVLLRLLDTDGDDTVSLQEFVVGEAVIHAVAHSKEAPELKIITWRALDADRSGSVDRNELATMVRIMVRLGAVRKEDAGILDLSDEGLSRGHHNRRKIARIKKEKVEKLVDHYMSMYDTAHDGKISHAEFEKHTALMENFWLLLKNHSLEPLFFLETEDQPSPPTSVA